MLHYKIHNLEQRSPEWFQFRKGKITASMVQAIMKESIYESPRQLYDRLMEDREITPNPSMIKGQEIEQEMLLWINQQTGSFFQPAVVTPLSNPNFIASLDGFDGEIHCEIKLASKDKHELAKKGIVPPCYKGQCQAQLYALGTQKGIYSSKNGESKVFFYYERDEKYIETMLKAINDFERRLIEFDPPELSKLDEEEIREPEALKEAEEYAQVCEQIDKLSERKDALRASLISRCRNTSKIGSLKLSKSYTTRIDYKKICETKGIDTSEYTNEPVEKWTLTISRPTSS